MNTKKFFITNRRAVREAFGKSDKDVERDIEIIREWAKTQSHLPELPNDNMIEMFLATNKFSIERTKPKLDMYYTIRSLIPDLYENANPQLPLMRDVPDKMFICVTLPKQTKDLCRVFMMKIIGAPEDFDTYRLYTHMFNMMEMKAQHDIAVGDVYVVDHQNFNMSHLLKITPVHLKKAAAVLEGVFSNRMRGMHILNSPPFMDIILGMVKAVFKAKLFERIQVHSSLEELYEHVPREILPRDYGGDELSLNELNDLCKEMLAENSDRFDELDKLRVNEALRPAPLENDEILGYHGNFKKLDVD